MQNTRIPSPAASSTLETTRAFVVCAHELPINEGPGERGAFLLTGAQTSNQVTVATATVDVNAGPPPHVHNNEDEIFLVQSGAFELLVNGELVVARAGDVAFMARGEAHRFRGLDSGEPNHLNVLVPPSGFENFMVRWVKLFEAGAPDMQEAVRLCGEYGIALYPSDDLAPAPPAQAQSKVVPAAAQKPLHLLGMNITPLLGATDTRSRHSLIRLEGMRDAGLPSHVHSREDKVFIVESGSVEFTLGAETVVVEAGDAVWVPRGEAHAFRVVSDNARLALFLTASGFEQFFAECERLELAGGAPISAIAQVAEKVGVTFLPSVR